MYSSSKNVSNLCGNAGKPRQGYLVELHRTAIDYLDINKSCDIDGIYGEHLTFSSYLLAELLSQCLSSLFTNGSLPDSLIADVLVPVIK